MSGAVILIVATIILLVLLFFRCPVFVSLFAASAVYFVVSIATGADINPAIYSQKAITGV